MAAALTGIWDGDQGKAPQGMVPAPTLPELQERWDDTRGWGEILGCLCRIWIHDPGGSLPAQDIPQFHDPFP